MNENYFDIRDTERISQINSNMIFYSILCSMGLALIMGQMFDILGRRLIIILACLTIALTIFITPYTSPSIALLMMLRCVCQVM